MGIPLYIIEINQKLLSVDLDKAFNMIYEFVKSFKRDAIYNFLFCYHLNILALYRFLTVSIVVNGELLKVSSELDSDVTMLNYCTHTQTHAHSHTTTHTHTQPNQHPPHTHPPTHTPTPTKPAPPPTHTHKHSWKNTHGKTHTSGHRDRL